MMTNMNRHPPIMPPPIMPPPIMPPQMRTNTPTMNLRGILKITCCATAIIALSFYSSRLFALQDQTAFQVIKDAGIRGFALSSSASKHDLVRYFWCLLKGDQECNFYYTHSSSRIGF